MAFYCNYCMRTACLNRNGNKGYVGPGWFKLNQFALQKKHMDVHHKLHA